MKKVDEKFGSFKNKVVPLHRQSEKDKRSLTRKI